MQILAGSIRSLVVCQSADELQEMVYGIELERSIKAVPDWFNNFISPGPVESVPGPVVMNGDVNMACFLQQVVVISW